MLAVCEPAIGIFNMVVHTVFHLYKYAGTNSNNECVNDRVRGDGIGRHQRYRFTGTL